MSFNRHTHQYRRILLGVLVVVEIEQFIGARLRLRRHYYLLIICGTLIFFLIRTFEYEDFLHARSGQEELFKQGLDALII